MKSTVLASVTSLLMLVLGTYAQTDTTSAALPTVPGPVSVPSAVTGTDTGATDTGAPTDTGVPTDTTTTDTSVPTDTSLPDTSLTDTSTDTALGTTTALYVHLARIVFESPKCHTNHIHLVSQACSNSHSTYNLHPSHDCIVFHDSHSEYFVPEPNHNYSYHHHIQCSPTFRSGTGGCRCRSLWGYLGGYLVGAYLAVFGYKDSYSGLLPMDNTRLMYNS